MSSFIDVENRSTLKVTGNVTNTGNFYTNFSGSFMGGNTVTIAGTLTNNAGATFSLNGNGDVANIGVLANSGKFYLGGGTTLNFTDNFLVTDVPASASYYIYGATDLLPFHHLGSIEGQVYLANGESLGITSPCCGPLTIAPLEF